MSALEKNTLSESEVTEPKNIVAQQEEQEAVAPAPRPRKPRGFAAMDRSLVSEIASKGGKAAHRAGTAHEFTTEEARAAGRKGGLAPHARRSNRPETASERPSS